VFVAIAVFLFAFSSIIGNYYYGEANIRFLTPKKSALNIYRVFSAGIVVLFGAIASLDIVWNIGDVCMACLAACNLIAIICLGKYAFRLLNDYSSQKKKGIQDPMFHKSQFPDIADRIECWD
jgi:AGCS family alanine or glycine:cation symporter